MPFVPVPNTAGVELLMLLDAQQIENTFYVSGAVAIPEEDLAGIAGIFLDWVASDYFPQLSNVISCVGVKVTDLSSDTAPTFTAVPESVLAGGVAQPSVPSATAWAAKRLTAGRGRSGRGRIYVPAIPETSRVGVNGLSTVFAGAIITALNLLGTDLSTAGWQPVVVSRISGGLPRVEGLAQPITSWAYSDLVLDTQSRRAPGRGS